MIFLAEHVTIQFSQNIKEIASMLRYPLKEGLVWIVDFLVSYFVFFNLQKKYLLGTHNIAT